MKKTINLSFAHCILVLLSGILFLTSGALKAQPCNPNFTYVIGSGSANKTVSFTSANKDTFVQHMWYFGDGSTSTAINPTKTYSTYGLRTICHVVTKGSICVDTFCTTINLTSSTPCVANYSYYRDSLKGDTFYFNNLSTGNNLVYNWTFGDSTTSTLASPKKKFNRSGTFTVCLTVRNLLDSTCINTKCSTIVNGNSNLPCISNFTYTKDTTKGNTFYFNNTSTGNNLGYYWNFGDGTTSTIKNPSKVYTQTGTFTVCLTVRNLLDTTCINTKCIAVVNGGNNVPCVANYTCFKDSLKGDTFYFNNTSTGNNLTYLWNFGDSTISTLANPKKIFNRSGTFTVCLTVRSLLDSTCINTKCSTIVNGNSNLPCISNFTYTKDTTKGNTFYFNNTSTGNNLGYYWNFGDGTSSTIKNPSKVYTQTGTFTVCLTVRNLLDTTCINTKCIAVVNGGNNVPCVANYTYRKDTINPINNHYFFNSTSTGNNLTYYWNFGDGTTSTFKNPDKTFTAPGNYNVCLTVRNLLDSTCISTKCSTVVIIVGNSTCHANFSYVLSNSRMNVNQYGCLFNATNSSGNNLLYSWNFGDGWTATTANYFHMFFPGVYNVCLTVRNAFDSTCIDTKCMLITVTGDSSQPCQTDFSYWQDSSMNNSTVYFNNASSKPLATTLTYLWNFGDGTTSNSASPIHTYPHAGTFTVCLTISSSADSCYDVKCKTINVRANSSNCNASFNYRLDSTGVALFNTVNTQLSGTNYSWTFGDGSSSTNANPAHLYAANGWYLVCLTIWRAADSCTNTVCDTIYVNNAGTGLKTTEGMSISNMYPIPAHNELNIDLLSLFNQETNLSIIDMTGKVCINKVYKTTIGQNNIKLDISDLLAGVYIIQINTPQGKIIHKMIK